MSKDRNLHGAIKEVFAAVYAVCFSKNGPGEIPLTFLEGLTGITRPTVVDCLRNLLQLGYIERVGIGKRHACIYMVKKYFPPASDQDNEQTKKSDQLKDLTSCESKLVKGVNQLEELTTDQLKNLTRTSKETKHNTNKQNNYTIVKSNKKNSHLFLEVEYKEKSTI